MSDFQKYQDPKDNSERIKQLEGLLEECESFLEDFMSGTVSLKYSMSEGDKLFQKLKSAKEGGK